jgi:hypothetical protein
MRYVGGDLLADCSTYPAAARCLATYMMLESNPAFPGQRT